jgi:hypothetical protein
MRAVARRLAKLEDQICSAAKPRRRLRIVIMADARPRCEDAECTRTLCPDGTLMEVVQFEGCRQGDHEPTDGEIEEWINTVPIQRLQVGGACWPEKRT